MDIRYTNFTISHLQSCYISIFTDKFRSKFEFYIWYPLREKCLECLSLFTPNAGKMRARITPNTDTFYAAIVKFTCCYIYVRRRHTELLYWISNVMTKSRNLSVNIVSVFLSPLFFIISFGDDFQILKIDNAIVSKREHILIDAWVSAGNLEPYVGFEFNISWILTASKVFVYQTSKKHMHSEVEKNKEKLEGVHKINFQTFRLMKHL